MNVRTQTELNNPREYNYYLVFKIDPTEKDSQRIDEVLKKAKMTWVQGAPIQRRYLALWQDIVNVMVNDLGHDSSTDSYSAPGARARELAAAKKYKLEAAANAIALAYGEQTCRSSLRDIVKKEKYNWYSLDELEAAVKAHGITVVEDAGCPLDLARMKEIDGLLRIVNKSSLYDFLGGSNDDDRDVLSAAADNAYRSIENRTSPEGAASSVLVVQVKKILSDAASKRKYDLFLASRERVWDEMKAISEGGCDLVSHGTRQRWVAVLEYVHQVPHGEAELYITTALKYYGLFAG